MNRFAGLRLLGSYLRPHRGRVALALLSLIVAAGTVLTFGACLRTLIDRGFSQGQPAVLHYALASVLVVVAVLAVASGSRFYLVSWLGERVVGDLRRDLFAHVVRLDPSWFEIKRSADVISRISSDAQLIEQVIGSSASVALRNTLMCVGGIAMLVITNPKLAALVLALVPVVVAPIIIFGRKVRALSREAQARIADLVSDGAGDARRGAHGSGICAGTAGGQALRRGYRTGLRGSSPVHHAPCHHDHAGDLHRVRRSRLPAVDRRAGCDRRPHHGWRSFGLRVLCRAGGELGRGPQRDDWRSAAGVGAAERLSELKAEPPVIIEAAQPSRRRSRFGAALLSTRSPSAIPLDPTHWRSIASILRSRLARP